MANEQISKIKSEYLVMDEYGYTDKELVDTVNILVDKVNELNAQIQHKAKTEPMQVELEGDGYADGKLVYDYGKCPKCGWTFEEDDKDWEEPFCCHCGQKLKWFEG